MDTLLLEEIPNNHRNDVQNPAKDGISTTFPSTGLQDFWTINNILYLRYPQTYKQTHP